MTSGPFVLGVALGFPMQDRTPQHLEEVSAMMGPYSVYEGPVFGHAKPKSRALMEP